VADFSSAAFRDTPVEVELNGRAYAFPVLSAQRWLTMLADKRRWAVLVLHHAEPESYEAFLDEAEAGRASAEDLARLARMVLAESAGRPWWEAERLCNAVLTSPMLTGDVLSRGVDPGRLTLAAFLAVVWTRATQGAKQTDRMQLEAELMAPPPEALQDMDDAMDLTSMAQMFRGMQGARVG
jgi:hypothetical protein